MSALPDRRTARVVQQQDGAVLLIVRDGTTRIMTSQLPAEDYVSVQPVLEHGAAVLERHGMRLSRPWTKLPSSLLSFAAAWESAQ